MHRVANFPNRRPVGLDSDGREAPDPPALDTTPSGSPARLMADPYPKSSAILGYVRVQTQVRYASTGRHGARSMGKG